MANPVGRPTDYKEEYCEKVVELGKIGASKEEFALELGIAVSTFYLWIDKHEEFSEAVKKAEMESIGWWKREGRTALRDKDFSYTGWYMNMKNRFGWKDKSETDITTKGEPIQSSTAVLPLLQQIDGQILDYYRNRQAGRSSDSSLDSPEQSQE